MLDMHYPWILGGAVLGLVIWLLKIGLFGTFAADMFGILEFFAYILAGALAGTICWWFRRYWLSAR